MAKIKKDETVMYTKGAGDTASKTKLNKDSEYEILDEVKGKDGKAYYKIKYGKKKVWILKSAAKKTWDYVYQFSDSSDSSTGSAIGFSDGGFIADAKKTAYRNGDDIVTFNTLKRGEAVLTPEQAKQFKLLAQNLDRLQGVTDIYRQYEALGAPNTTATRTTGNVNVGGISVTIPVDHVQDYNDFVRQLRDDKTFERMIQSITIDPLVGGSTLAKKKYYN